ncbi:protein Niban 2 [Oncorhynchus keta]|uniref:protein Niban 2 n=1 Tax=Oncorhynchus keta TaxID=8018 RepID=UPI0015FC1A07|nr:protein Niban 2 [Oncorhynchus keta]XP_052381601.1 protein Niban 2 [Oncorhynchus keta]XP_052381602.1 protein Niban 2 [Oncorhynchus keta]XP_052381603.1 protein Niban 2 [Oncorhynchus keta]XP_052381604.1 protein Niban 2 [Oncorhynchus keta]XP_052381605.1 protein Niban 2 [Oncorhynchus keta]XP_052381606.1 protein Niban 2 [Oncorhynchus keta]
MGDVISTHLDEGKREMITARTRQVTGEFGHVYEQQYAVALFNSVRFEIEGGGAPQSQLLHRKNPLEDRSIFSGGLFQYLEENKRWRNRFVFVADTYNISFYENKMAHERSLRPKGTINCAGYKALTSMEEYLELINTSLPGIKAKVGSGQFVKCATQFPLILWHPYARHHYFCVLTEKEQKKWHAVLQDCVRHSNNGLSEECRVQTPAFTDAMRLHRQAQGHYGTWDMMCGGPPQILANLVMETLHPELRNLIGPRLKGKIQQRQRNWMLISEAVYKQVLSQTQAQYEALVQACEFQTSRLDTVLRTDMDQIITSKEHVSGKIRALVLPRAGQLLRGSVQPFLSSILEALMEPTSRGFSEVRDVFFRELVEVSKNTLNGGGKDKLAEHMEKISMLAFHPVKMQSCYEKVEQLNLEGLQQRFDVSSPSVFIQRAQILMREQMDNAVYTFEHLLHQSLEGKVQGGEDLCKTIHCCQDRVLKKYDYDSSTVRKKFFKEALLQIIIPYMLKQLSPSFHLDLPRFQELIFEDFSQFILVENVFEEVVLQSVTKDIMMAVKEAAVQKKHNLYRDSMILTNSDPNLHLLGENPSVDWATQFRGGNEEPEGALGGGGQSSRRRRQVVSMIQLDEMGPLPYESCMEVPGVDFIPEEGEIEEVEVKAQEPKEQKTPTEPDSPDSVQEICYHSKPVVEMMVSASEEDLAVLTNGTGTLKLEDGKEEEVTLITTVVEEMHRKSPQWMSAPQEVNEQLVETGSPYQEAEGGLQEKGEAAIEGKGEEDEAAIKNAIQEIEIAVQEEDGERITECAVDSDAELAPPLVDSNPSGNDDGGFQLPTNEALNEGKAQPILDALKTEDTVVDPGEVVVVLEPGDTALHNE